MNWLFLAFLAKVVKVGETVLNKIELRILVKLKITMMPSWVVDVFKMMVLSSI